MDATDAPPRRSVAARPDLPARLPAHLPALLAAAAGVAASLAVDGGAAGLLGAGLAVVMAAIAVTDARHFLIPDRLNAAAALLGLASAALDAPDAAAAVGLALARGSMLALAFLALRVGYRHLRGREGLGLGDVKLAGVAGIWLDGLMLPAAIEIAAATALAVCLLEHIRGGRAIRAGRRLPFGLFFAPAIWLAWWAGIWLDVAL